MAYTRSPKDVVGLEGVSRDNIAKFIAMQCDIGREATYIMKKGLPGHVLEEKQYLIASLVTTDELIQEDYRSLIEYWDYLLDHGIGAPVPERFILYNRTVTLLNTPSRHGEARLCDNNGRILADVLTRRDLHLDLEENYLQKMKQCLIRDLGMISNYVVILFTYNIPCVQPKRMCAQLLAEYVKRTRDTIIIGYDSSYWTESDDALECMDRDHILVIQPRFIQHQVNKEIRQQYDNPQYYRKTVKLNHKHAQRHRKLRHREARYDDENDINSDRSVPMCRLDRHVEFWLDRD